MSNQLAPRSTMFRKRSSKKKKAEKEVERLRAEEADAKRAQQEKEEVGSNPSIKMSFRSIVFHGACRALRKQKSGEARGGGGSGTPASR